MSKKNVLYVLYFLNGLVVCLRFIFYLEAGRCLLVGKKNITAFYKKPSPCLEKKIFMI